MPRRTSIRGCAKHFREWRRADGKRNGIAAFIMMHDTSLDEICRKRPQSLGELRRVSGFGERKTELYGEQILQRCANLPRRRAGPGIVAGNSAAPAGTLPPRWRQPWTRAPLFPGLPAALQFG